MVPAQTVLRDLFQAGSSNNPSTRLVSGGASMLGYP